MVRRVLAVTNNFPTSRFPERGAFVMNMLRAMARAGASIDVIAPVSRLAAIKTWRNQSVALEFDPLRVKQPYVTLIPLRFSGCEVLITAFNDRQFSRVIRNSLAPGDRYDFAYTHFLPSGRALLPVARQRRVPVMLNMGESDPWDYDELYGTARWARELDEFAGIVTVSKRSLSYLADRNPGIVRKLRYLPNGVDLNRFMPLDRVKCRERLGLPARERIALFCGHFDHRKGPLRVLEALEHVGIRGVFLGSNGPDRPVGSNVLFAGSIANSETPAWYNSADVFVLPSLSEGMSNAMLEALACGVPLVVGDLEVNRSFLNPEVARFVDPLSATEIARGIDYCLDAANSARMRAACVALSLLFSLEKRALDFLEFAQACTRQ